MNLISASPRNDSIVTGGYWAFTIVDGAICMPVVLYFHPLKLPEVSPETTKAASSRV